jgi:hypothetical protein
MSKKSFFWASYADLMTSLFFIMLTLFVLTIVMLKRQSEATETELNKIREIQNAVSNIDSTYFEYNEKHKKHILKIDVSFQTGSADISNINDSVLVQLKNAGKTIQSFILKTYEKYAGVQYLLIIEGQASKDNYLFNDELSYNRALALKKIWKDSLITFDPKQCEVIVSGSGASGDLRMEPDIPGNEKNQRFLIHILPKPGIIK